MKKSEESVMPQSIQEIEQLIGTKATLLLVERFGGIRFYVPQTITSDHELARLIGIDAAQKLTKHYGGGRYEVPRLSQANLDRRNIEIKNQYRFFSQSQLAVKFGLTQRQVRNIVGTGKNDDQMELF